MKTLLITLVSLINLNIMAKKPVAMVVITRGEISILRPRTLKAIPLTNGMSLSEDSSILSGEKSFARIKFSDGSILNIGPESKLVVKIHKPNGKTLLSLLKGRIRATVNKSKKGAPNKFFIKTKTAALGVRGTDFQTTFDPASGRTSLLTYEGSVAIKKVRPSFEKRVDSFSDEDKINFVQKTLEKEDQLAEVGDFTNVDPVAKKATATVKVSAQQLVLLERDSTMGVDKVKFKKAAFSKAVKEKNGLIKQNAEKRGLKLDEKNLGLIDTKTGLYIPKKDGKAVGRISGNGQYLAPRGLTLDSRKGFISTTKEGQEKAKSLNEELLIDQVSDESVNPAYLRYFKSN